MKTYAIITGIAILTGMIILGAMTKGTQADNVINERNAKLEAVYNW